MSAPHAKHGSPSRAQILRVADQLAECGVFSVSITGGEPLVRGDLPEIIDLLNERETGLSRKRTKGRIRQDAARCVFPGKTAYSPAPTETIRPWP